jgi:hypothetical protein
MHLLWGAAHNQTQLRERERERERERRETGNTKEVWTDETEGLKRLLEYAKKIGSFHGI